MTASRPPDREDTTMVVKVGAIAPRSTPPDRCTITVLAGPAAGTVVALEKDVLTIGRGEAADLRIDDPGLSRKHVRVYRDRDGILVQDLGSRNGTSVDGVALGSTLRVADGARVRIGQSTVLRIEVHDALEQDATRSLYESATRDPLTRLFNRRHLDERLAAEVAHSARHGAPLALLLVDLDHFKNVNDDPGLGHPAGDAVLRVVAATLQRLVRTEDVVARYGGEELAIVARSTSRRNAAILAERVRRAIEELSIPWHERTIRITASIGVASLEDLPAPRTVATLLARVDEVLYEAKNKGRNRVVVAE